jgi:diguanylate cyclase (GGDEF)-like protein
MNSVASPLTRIIPMTSSAARTDLPAPVTLPEGAPLAVVACTHDVHRKAATRWMAHAGFQVVGADDGQRALELIGQLRPALVLAEMGVCDATGRPVCQALREQSDTADLPLLALCASDREVQAALEQGATDVLRRPFDWRLFTTRAERVARASAASAELSRLRAEMARIKKAQDDERRDWKWVDHADPLTGLPDGDRLERALESALAGANEGSQVAVAVFDIEHLVMINSRLGRARANSVLQQIAQRLVGALRSEEVLRASSGPSISMAARLGGGMFGAVLTALPGWQEAKAAVRVLLDSVAGRYFVGEEDIVLSASVGVAMAPADGRTAEALLQKAEVAANEAGDGGGAIRFYGQVSHRLSERSRAVMRLLATAQERGELDLHYQPLVAGPGHDIAAAEALLRWNSPELGPIGPSEFVPLAEEAGLMVPMGRWVLQTACRQMKAWREAGVPPVRVAINVSLCQLVRGDFDRVVRECLEETGVPPAQLELELSERGVLRGDPDILRQLEELRAAGVALAIDDFGTGNSAVSYLKQFPIDVLKIDQSFVKGVATSSEDAAIASATIAMARQLGLRVVAEGVEEPRQVEFLRRHGCLEYQGYLFSPAVPAEEFASLLRRGVAEDGWRHDAGHGEQGDENH